VDLAVKPTEVQAGGSRGTDAACPTAARSILRCVFPSWIHLEPHLAQNARGEGATSRTTLTEPHTGHRAIRTILLVGSAPADPACE
jgi:hypothetical protein